jgi:ubiquinone/menaquinone biosynthesis C-methylase UbiE
MTAKAHADNAAILDAYDFSKYRVMADIAGGRGHLLKAVLAKYPAANGILFDLPEVVGSVESSARMSLVAGDFFKNELPAADAYLLGHILHDWEDEEATAILRSIRRVAPAQAKLLVLEFILPEEPGPHPAKVLDILMLAVTGGLERTTMQYGSLLAAGGFKLERVVPTASSISVIVAAPED